ncbi:MAG: DMT family transporter [Chloroflexota bacterium]|nr:DMT family transporter [Chloroflexota bacterium]MDE2885343.1 DMT family transporter [Chloroflexota bacterium]
MMLYVWIAVGVMSVSFASIFIRLAEAPPLTVAAYRMGIAAVIVGVTTGIAGRGGFAAVRRFDLPLLGGSAFFLAAHFALWTTSLSHTSVASSVLLVTTTPIFVAVLAHFTSPDKVGRLTALAVVVSMAGGVVIAAGDWAEGERHLLGDALALAGAVAVAGYLLAGRRVRGHIPNLAYVTIVYAIAAVLLLAAAVGSGAPMLGLPMESYFWMAMAAVLPQAVGHSLLNWALGYLPAVNVTLAVRGEPVLATLLAIPVLGEVPPWTVLPGGALLLLGVYLAVRSGEARRANV